MTALMYDVYGRAIDLAGPAFGSPEWNAKYGVKKFGGGADAAQRGKAVDKGLALPPAGGKSELTGSGGNARFPLAGPDGKPSEAMFTKATKMVQLAKGNQPAIRRWLMKQAKVHGWTAPADWNADGSVKADMAAGTDLDDTPAGIASGLDATLDAAIDLLNGVDLTSLPANVQQAIALVVSAAVSSDELLQAMDLPDPDDDIL